MFWIWGIQDVTCSKWGMFRIWDVWDVGYSEGGILWDAGCPGCRMFQISDVQELGCVVSKILDIHKVACLECRMFRTSNV